MCAPLAEQAPPGTPGPQDLGVMPQHVDPLVGKEGKCRFHDRHPWT
jgi:hypothetical protein